MQGKKGVPLRKLISRPKTIPNAIRRDDELIKAYK